MKAKYQGDKKCPKCKSGLHWGKWMTVKNGKVTFCDMAYYCLRCDKIKKMKKR